MTDNPFLAVSDLPYHLPKFEDIATEHYRPAFEAGMAEELAAVEAIAANPEEPTFENTVVALERAGSGTLERVSLVFYNQNTADTDPDLQALETEFNPKLSEHRDKILLNADLFARIDALWRRTELGLDEQDERLLERYHTEFVRGGAALDEAGKTRLAQLNAELAELSAKYNQQVLADINDAAVHVRDRSELDGLSAAAIEAAAAAAADHGLDGYLLTQQLYSCHPQLERLTDRSLRERLWRASTSRGAANAPTVLAMARLRAERARLLGFRHHADYIAADQTAGDAEIIAERLADLAAASVRNARAEAAELQELIDAEGGGFELAAWDWPHYAGKVRQAKYGFDAESLQPYLELDRVLFDGVFHAAEKEFGMTFREREDLAGYHPEVRVFEVFDADGATLGLFLADFFTRDSKKGGAWMNALVVQSELTGYKPVVVNNLNIVAPAEGKPALVTVDNVRTMFHEFGHAIHGLLSACRYPKTSMTSTPRDFVEYPSQVNEMWIRRPEVVSNYARHHETGEAAPAELLEQWEASGKFGEGFSSTEYLAAAILDQAWHRLAPEEVPDGGDDPAAAVEAFEREALERAGIAMAQIAPRYRSGYFAHIFAGGYSAGYYSYIWSEILDADTVEWFEENGGLTRANGDHFREHLLSRGGSIDPMESYRRFRGRDARIEPLLERRGLK
ncbi:M3 family metallopeptidase [Glycomyces halotolerans]